MKYYEVEFTVPDISGAADLLVSYAGDIGFEAFDESGDRLMGYIQRQLYDEEALKAMVDEFPMGSEKIVYTVREAEDKDWNEQWEQEGFEPIPIGKDICIHDGRHLPPCPTPVSIEIDAKMAFGTGTHETTRMVVKVLTETDLHGKSVLDCGCGTGILSIAALKSGAASAIGYDIDEWSVDNARHNAVINGVDSHFQSLLGDASLIDTLTDRFDIVVANINRNILLADMEQFRKALVPGGTLILSGFYESDIPQLTEKAARYHLHPVHQLTDNEWSCLVLA